jgi:hypothetical protein
LSDSDLEDLNWAQRFERRIRTHPLLVVFFLASVLVSSFVVLSTAAFSIREWYRDRFEWREEEYRKLTSLRAGFSLAKFHEALGSPVFERNGRDMYLRPFPRGSRINPSWKESSFQGRDYWVQTVSNRSGVVLLYAVTSCDRSFRPTFTAPYKSFRVTLRRSSFASVVPRGDRDRNFDLYSLYFVSGATANSYFFDALYGGNPLDYKSFAWGLNDACAGWHPYYESLYERKLLPFGNRYEYHGITYEGGKEIQRFRQEAIVNTYAETAPAVRFDLRQAPVMIGVDRILIRTTR